jgi:hypothetical protein
MTVSHGQDGDGRAARSRRSSAGGTIAAASPPRWITSYGSGLAADCTLTPQGAESHPLGSLQPRSSLLRDSSLDDCVESFGSERGIVTKVEVDLALKRAIGVERGPTTAAHIVALVGALPGELNARPAITIRIAAVELSRHRDEAQLTEAVIIELDEAGLDQIDGLLIPVVHLGDTPPANDARALGHATRIAARVI